MCLRFTFSEHLSDWPTDAVHTCHAAGWLIGDWIGAQLGAGLSVQTASKVPQRRTCSAFGRGNCYGLIHERIGVNAGSGLHWPTTRTMVTVHIPSTWIPASRDRKGVVGPRDGERNERKQSTGRTTTVCNRCPGIMSAFSLDQALPTAAPPGKALACDCAVRQTHLPIYHGPMPRWFSPQIVATVGPRLVCQRPLYAPLREADPATGCPL